MKIKNSFIKSIAILSVALFALTACSSFKAEDSKEVIQKFKEAVKDIKSADMSLAFTMSGTDTKDTIDFDLNADVKLDRRDDVDRKAVFDVKADGKMVASGKTLDGDLAIQILSAGKELYFNLDKFDSTDPNTESFKALFEPYMKKWQHLASDFVPKSIKDLQEKDAETLAKEDQLMDLFENTKLLEVTKEYGVETLNGAKVYHYGVQINKEGVKDYITKASVINGREMTEAEVDNAVTFVDSITKMEMWIGVKDYYLYKGVVALSGNDTEKNVTSDISLTYTANSYNKDPKITAPSSSEEFNPMVLLMGMQLGATPDTTASEGDSTTGSAAGATGDSASAADTTTGTSEGATAIGESSATTTTITGTEAATTAE